MVAIVLCDDDPFTLQLLSELLERAIRQSKAEANLSVWPLLVRSRSSLSAAVEAISIFSIMTWEGLPPNGVDLVRQIYHTDPGGKIVFVTGHGEKGMDILRSGVRPFGFIENVWIRFPLAILIGGIVAAVFGILIGIPALMVKDQQYNRKRHQ